MGMRQVISLLLAGAAAVVFPACDDDAPSGRQDNVFLEQRPPRYGHGGTQSPSNRPAPTVPQNQYGQRQSPTIYLTQPEPSPEPKPQPQNDYSVVTPNNPSPIVDPEPELDPQPSMVETETTLEPEPTPEPEPEPTPPPKTNPSGLPYGIPVPGKPSYVYSPHDSQKRFVNVEGIPPGTEVKCPYTQKTFLVP